MSARKLFEPMINELKGSHSRPDQIQGAMFEVLVENTEETKSATEAIRSLQEEISPIKQTHVAIVRERWLVAKIGMVAGSVCAFLAFFLPWAIPNFWADYRPALTHETRYIAKEAALETVKEYDSKVSVRITILEQGVDALEHAIDKKQDKP